MGKKKYIVKLSRKQRKKLINLTRRGESKARQLTRARVLLLSDENRPKGCMKDNEISDILHVSLPTIFRIRRQFVTEGLDEALGEKLRCGRPKVFDGKDACKITALACTDPPEGHAKWSLRLLADRVVELEYVESISYVTVFNILKKNELSPHLRKQWCIGKLTPQFLWRMEDILNLYEQDYDASRPLICFDERPCQLIDDVIQPLPMQEGKVKREDYHYKRNGVCNVFIAFNPHTGQRLVEVYERRTRQEYADFFRRLSAGVVARNEAITNFPVEHYPHASTITVVQDNLNTHSPASFYQCFPPEEALALAQKFSMHYTPVNASWLNMAELELAALSKQCLDRRIGDMETLKREVLAWAEERNQKHITVNWQFTNDKARDKFSRFYPKLS